MSKLIRKALKLAISAGLLVGFLSTSVLAENLILKFIINDEVGEAWTLHPASLSAYTSGMDAVPYVFYDDFTRLCIGSNEGQICATFDQMLESEGSSTRFILDDGREGTVHFVSAND